MIPAVLILVYLAVGVGAAAYRAYLDPILIARGDADKWSWDRHSSWYHEALLSHLILWPIAVPYSLLGVGMEEMRKRGIRELERRKVAQALAEKSAREIDRIIAEHHL